VKTLYLVRHARARPADAACADRDRPLDDRGERDAAAMGRRLARRGVAADRLQSSTALRALQTAAIFAREFGLPPSSIVGDDRLYAGSAGALLALVQGLDARIGTALLFGHNPTFSELVRALSGRFVDLPTCAVAELRFDVPGWSEVGAASAPACTIETPKH
jgi:phosphohistidine phosphatase